MNIDPNNLDTGCVNTYRPFTKAISSLEVFGGVQCDFFLYVLLGSKVYCYNTKLNLCRYRSTGCGGRSFGVRNLYVKDLSYTGYNDEIQSYHCKACLGSIFV